MTWRKKRNKEGTYANANLIRKGRARRNKSHGGLGAVSADLRSQKIAAGPGHAARIAGQWLRGLYGRALEGTERGGGKGAAPLLARCVAGIALLHGAGTGRIGMGGIDHAHHRWACAG